MRTLTSSSSGGECRNPKCQWGHWPLLLVGESVVTLALGLRPRQGVARWRAKRETREHVTCPRECKVWGNQPSHSQVNSHVGSWSPKRTPESSERNCRGQNSSSWEVLYITGKLLECRCLKWARIAHLDIWNTSYGQKKGRESNCQFERKKTLDH
jgi:hypothetical protein